MSESTGVPVVDAVVVWSAAIAAVVGLAGVLWRIARPVRRVAHQVEEFIDDWKGTPGRPGVPARPGVMERLGRIEHHTGIVASEVQPNGGSSLRDAITRVDRRTATLTGDDQQQ